ncbi:MAG: hypothetical protein NXI32_08960 [bacterium]|nr:hypothetical protein [bacterium]
MEARLFSSAHALRGWVLAGMCLLYLHQSCTLPVLAQHHPGHKFVVHSQNFIVFASSPDWAAQVSKAAEDYRRDLAVYWLGKELPAWAQRCPLHVTASSELGASGETRFSPTAAGVGNWMMSVNGTPERILDSVLPHEISHTILATHFAAYAHSGRFVPRWADEGACTTVEHESEKKKHRHFLHQFLQTGRGLAFGKMFRMKDYPRDILPLYAQGHSAVQFLIDQSSPREFIQFLEQGMQTGSWEKALQEHYAYQSIGEFQSLWNKWLFDGSPADIAAYAPRVERDRIASLASNAGSQLPSANLQDSKEQFAIWNTGPAPTVLAGQQPTTTVLPEFPAAAADQQHIAAWESYYKRRLREVSGGTAPAATENGAALSFVENLPSRDPILAQTYSSQAASRMQPARSPQVHVLELGNSVPLSGAQYAPPAGQSPLPEYGRPSSKQPLSGGSGLEAQPPVRMVPIDRL